MCALMDDAAGGHAVGADPLCGLLVGAVIAAVVVVLLATRRWKQAGAPLPVARRFARPFRVAVE